MAISFRSSRSNQAGQTIIEVLIATGVVALVMTAVAAGMAVSVKSTAQAKYRALASKMAQENLEMFRRERDRWGWETFYQILQQDGVAVRYCLASTLPAADDPQAFINLTAAAGECTTGVQKASTDFIRQVDVTLVSADLVRVKATVKWYDGNNLRTLETTQELQNWR